MGPQLFKCAFTICILLVLLALGISLALRTGKQSDDGGGSDARQEWGHVTVREHAHMFWWLYYTTADVFNYTERPLIIWLQGGPGMPSSGYGNFGELGPLDSECNKRDYSPVQDYNVLFIDNPVGVGYSYITNNNAKIPHNNVEIGEDLVRFLRIFLERKRQFRNVPLYIFGESYGGKMAVEFAHQLKMKESQDNESMWDLRGIGLGDAFISPVDHIRMYAPMAFYLGLVDKQGFRRIDELAKQIEVLINKKEYKAAANQDLNMSTTLCWKEMLGVDFYNFVQARCDGSSESGCHAIVVHKMIDRLEKMMNAETLRQLGLELPPHVKWTFFSNHVFEHLVGDLMRSVTDKVEYLLNETSIKVIVYSGVLDFLVSTAGTRQWLDNLNWSHKEIWHATHQTSLVVNAVSEGYMKRVENLMLYVIFRAGHSVPVDNMPAFRKMLADELLAD